ncbi:MAG: TetR/AcrR family transcriptional regulator [Spirochaetaceae bacterium]|jgi:AcrR family transcriptional regulator|nr:TetR/AcrR family transcriptional regulator [Spirochaetaceae bacterium]
MEKTDIRIQFTQKALQDGLVSLMKEKSILRISTREVCERAGLSRSTFYTYYNNQYDLLRQIENQTLVEAEKTLQPYIGVVRKSNGRETIALLQAVLQYIVSNNNSIQVLLSKNGDSTFQLRFFRKGIEVMWRFTEAAGIKVQDKEVARYSPVFLLGGILSLVQEWLQNGMDIPVPELAKMLARLTQDALR